MNYTSFFRHLYVTYNKHLFIRQNILSMIFIIVKKKPSYSLVTMYKEDLYWLLHNTKEKFTDDF